MKYRDYTIQIYNTPLEKEVLVEIIEMCERNNFPFRASELSLTGSILAVARDSSRIIASRRFKENIFKNQNDRVSAVQCCETITDASFRGRGLFSALWNEVRPILVSNYQYIYNFPNSNSIKPYLKNGFVVSDYVVTFATTKEISVNDSQIKHQYFDECIDVAGNQFSNIYLKNGLHRYIPLAVFGSIKGRDKVKSRLKIFSCSLNSLRKIHEMYFIKSLYANIRPITYFPLKNSLNPSDIYISPASYDTVK